MKTKWFMNLVALFAFPAWADLTVYTDRAQDRFSNAALTFEKQTGQKVIFVEGAYKDLLGQLETEGKDTPADVIITKDLIYLNELTSKNLLQPMQKTKAVETVRTSMRDDRMNWVALSYRARTVAYDPSRVQPSELTTYKDLASSKWQGRLCLRTSKAAYNEALASYLIDQHGVNEAKAIVAGWVKNLAAPVFTSDIPVLEAIANGVCDVGLVNHYYLALTINKDPNFPVRIAFLEQDGAGVHTNGSGAGIIASSLKPALAQQFIDILLSDSVQLELSAAHFDYPAASHLTPTTLIKDWGSFKAANNLWSDLSKWKTEARKIMDEVGYQ